MTATQEQGIFSLTFSVAGDRKEHSVDWNHPQYPGVWSHSRQRGVGWDQLGEIGSRERLVLISNFGLKEVGDELLLETIRRTPPQELLLKRRQLEMEQNLPELTISSTARYAYAP